MTPWIALLCNHLYEGIITYEFDIYFASYFSSLTFQIRNLSLSSSFSVPKVLSLFLFIFLFISFCWVKLFVFVLASRCQAYWFNLEMCVCVAFVFLFSVSISLFVFVLYSCLCFPEWCVPRRWWIGLVVYFEFYSLVLFFFCNSQISSNKANEKR